MASWPGSLPSSFLVESLSDFRRQNQSIVAPTDIGPGITRVRTTAYSKFFSGDMLMTPTQYDTLVAFYDTTLIGGSQPFDWTDPITGTSESLKFDVATEGHLAVTQINTPDLWTVHLAFEILPS